MRVRVRFPQTGALMPLMMIWGWMPGLTPTPMGLRPGTLEQPAIRKKVPNPTGAAPTQRRPLRGQPRHRFSRMRLRLLFLGRCFVGRFCFDFLEPSPSQAGLAI